MLNEEIIRFWGEGSLARWPRASVAEENLPEDAKKFLAEVGLPRGVDWTMRFDPAKTQPGDPRYVVIGYDDEVPICLDKQHRGRVVSLEAGGIKRFVNSDIRQFGGSLVLYQQYRLAVRDLGDKGAEGLIFRTEEAMKANDPPAFSDSEYWWPEIIEQMRVGLL